MVGSGIHHSIGQVCGRAVTVSGFLLRPIFLYGGYHFQCGLARILSRVGLGLLVVLYRGIYNSFFVGGYRFLILYLGRRFPYRYRCLRSFVMWRINYDPFLFVRPVLRVPFFCATSSTGASLSFCLVVVFCVGLCEAGGILNAFLHLQHY